MAKPDDYYRKGSFEVARFGKDVVMRNGMSSEEHSKYFEHLDDLYPEIRQEIDNLIAEIRAKIAVCEPLGILNYAASIVFSASISDRPRSEGESPADWSVEYIQSVLASTASKYQAASESEDQSELFAQIVHDVRFLYERLSGFYFAWTAHTMRQHPDIPRDIVDYIVEAQMMRLVRGDRYQVYEIEHLRSLLMPHSEKLAEVFDANADQVLEGLKQLQYALSQGRAEALNQLGRQYDDFEKAVESGTDPEEYAAKMSPAAGQICDKVFGTALNDVAAVTGWSDKLISCLTMDINEDQEFFADKEFPGWPIMFLPIQKKPFIQIGGRSYCFDYYSLFDNIYRVIQKTLTRMDPSYRETWAQKQQDASETMVEDLFKRLLPGCSTHRDNYYPVGGSTRDFAENDLLVVYDDVLCIVEVKAGSFSYTAPITDYESHIRSFQALAEKADHQCNRTYQYMMGRDTAPIYDDQRRVKCELDSHGFNHVFQFSVTVDNFNEFAAKAEKLSFISLKSNSIVISIDDLRVYAEYFQTPLSFLHYLTQRQKATCVQKLTLYDELDHLGMYIHFNLYSEEADKRSADLILWNGYRKDLDRYFMSRYIPGLEVKRPEQSVPTKIRETIAVLSGSGHHGRVGWSNFILDLSPDVRKQLDSQITHQLARQKETHRMMPLSGFGTARYCVFSHQVSVASLTEQETVDYVLAFVLRNRELDRLQVDLFYDSEDRLRDVKCEMHRFKDIPESDYERLLELGRKYAQSRIKSYMQQTGKTKIGRNEMCPCGSGLKYKKCCGALGTDRSAK